MYELSKLGHVLGVMSQTRVPGGNQNHHPHTYSLTHYSLDNQETQLMLIHLSVSRISLNVF